MTVRPLQTGRDYPVTGVIVSLDPTTGVFGIKVFGMEGEGQFSDVMIRLQPLDPDVASQRAHPVKILLGQIFTEFPLAALSVDRGVIRYPGCSGAEQGHEIAFDGMLTLGKSTLKVDGSFFDYAYPPPTHDTEPGITSGKRG